MSILCHATNSVCCNNWTKECTVKC
jgi:hypothetical protein